jgi:hypothetical protein
MMIREAGSSPQPVANLSCGGSSLTLAVVAGIIRVGEERWLQLGLDPPLFPPLQLLDADLRRGQLLGDGGTLLDDDAAHGRACFVVHLMCFGLVRGISLAEPLLCQAGTEQVGR